MELAQLEQIVNWLDEEHRRSRNEIVRLGHLVESQNADLVDQNKLIQELESSLSRAGLQSQRMQQLEEALDKTRQEMVALLEREEEQRQRVQRDQERARVGEREGWRREFNNLQRELGRISKVEQSLLLREEDLKRLQESLQELSAQIESAKTTVEERTEHVPFLMENKNSEQKRLRQLQEDQVEVFRKVESLGQELTRLEAEDRKLRSDFGILHAAGDKVQRDLDTWREETRSEKLETVQKIRMLDAALQELPSQFEQLKTQINSLVPFQDSAQRALAEVRTLHQRLDQGLQQIREESRVFRAKLEKSTADFQAGLGERDRKDRMRVDHLAQSQTKLEALLEETMQPVQQSLQLHDDLIQHLWDLQATYPRMALEAAQETVDNLHQALRERDRLVRSMEDEWTKMRRRQELYADNGRTPTGSP